MPRRKVSNPLALAVLSCLAERPMHPYEMSTTMRERGKHESIKLNYGSLYSVVDSLHKHGLITTRETTRAGRRPERTAAPARHLHQSDPLCRLFGPRRHSRRQRLLSGQLDLCLLPRPARLPQPRPRPLDPDRQCDRSLDPARLRQSRDGAGALCARHQLA